MLLYFFDAILQNVAHRFVCITVAVEQKVLTGLTQQDLFPNNTRR